jgi:hypothetical protein
MRRAFGVAVEQIRALVRGDAPSNLVEGGC